MNKIIASNDFKYGGEIYKYSILNDRTLVVLNKANDIAGKISIFDIFTGKEIVKTEESKNFDPFPFFLRRETDKSVEVITFHDYELVDKKAKYMLSNKPSKAIADKVENMTLTGQEIRVLIFEGYKWFFVDELNELW